LTEDGRPRTDVRFENRDLRFKYRLLAKDAEDAKERHERDRGQKTEDGRKICDLRLNVV